MEIELKLAVPAAALPALAKHPALAQAKAGRSRRQPIVTVYYDTAERGLAAHDMALRVRREGRRYVQTLKGPAGGHTGGGLAARAEHTWRLPARGGTPAPDLDRLRECALGVEALHLLDGHAPLPLFVTTFTRTRIPLRFADGTTAFADIDVGRIHVPPQARRREPIAELELELREGELARLFELAAVLAEDLRLRVEPRSKAERGYALAGAPAPAPQRATPLAYGRKDPAPHAFAVIVASCLRQIERNALGVAARAEDPEWIHQLRVGVRRLRSALALARPLLAEEARAMLAEQLRWLANALGPARDLDVLVATTLPGMREATQRALGASEHVDAIVAMLAAAAEARRARAQDDARAAVASPRFQRVLLDAGRLVASLAGASADAAGAPPDIATFARKALAKRHKRLLAAGRDIDRCTPAERHAVRIAAKKLRYAAEFLAPSFSGRRARSYRAALAALQEALGGMNDAAVAATLVADLCGARSPAAMLCTGWAAARTSAAHAALADAWSAFAKARPYWA